MAETGKREKDYTEPLGNALSRMYPGLMGRTEALANEFRNAKPFRHVIIGEFLAPEFVERLIHEFRISIQLGRRTKQDSPVEKLPVPTSRRWVAPMPSLTSSCGPGRSWSGSVRCVV